MTMIIITAQTSLGHALGGLAERMLQLIILPHVHLQRYVTAKSNTCL